MGSSRRLAVLRAWSDRSGPGSRFSMSAFVVPSGLPPLSCFSCASSPWRCPLLASPTAGRERSRRSHRAIPHECETSSVCCPLAPPCAAVCRTPGPDRHRFRGAGVGLRNRLVHRPTLAHGYRSDRGGCRHGLAIASARARADRRERCRGRLFALRSVASAVSHQDTRLRSRSFPHVSSSGGWK